jgi:hypothetical protein
MKRLASLLVLPFALGLGACAAAPAADTPPDPALRDVRILYVHAPPEWIRERGVALRFAKSANDQTLAFSELRLKSRTCIVTLPYPDSVGEELYERVRAHEERHCHGEQHVGRTFADEEPFD